MVAASTSGFVNTALIAGFQRGKVLVMQWPDGENFNITIPMECVRCNYQQKMSIQSLWMSLETRALLIGWAKPDRPDQSMRLVKNTKATEIAKKLNSQEEVL